MKVRLLNDGSYEGMQDFKYSTELNVSRYEGPIELALVHISTEELVEVGADPEAFIDEEDSIWPFLPGEYEMIQEKEETDES